MPTPRRLICGLLALLLAPAPAYPDSAPPGADIYLRGSLPNGTPLTGVREGGIPLDGEDAACVNCHRPSGLGNLEGNIRVPPIIGPYLFRPGDVNVHDLELPHLPGFIPRDWAYTQEGFVEALRTGVRPDGSILNALMPRYTIDEPAAAMLADYLRTLSTRPNPGVTPTTVDFATIVTPDADPRKRDAMLTVLEKYFASQREIAGARVHEARDGGEVEYRVWRRWQLHVWQLSGEPGTWAKQLQEKFAAEPVFAVISGIGRRTWAPVHAFCERNHVPCLLPNVDLPVVAEHDFYSVYFSRGVLLEADLIAKFLSSDHADRRHRLVQLYRPNDIGAVAARVLAEHAERLGMRVDNRKIESATSTGRSGMTPIKALAGIAPDDALVLWLRPNDVAKLGAVPPSATSILISGLMAGLEEAPLPTAWRERVTMAYTVDPPDRRRVRMNFPLAWLRGKGIPATALRVQADTYLACDVAMDALDHVLDAYVPEYMLERMESMLSRRLSNGFYPRFGLAPSQRFASKGGYFVRLPGPPGPPVVLESDWIVP